MHLDLTNAIVGLGSFWNLVMPTIAVIVFVVGLLVVALSRSSARVRPGVLIAGIGIVLFVVAAVGDEVGNAHDVTALETAVHDRYGLDIDYADAVALFGSTAGTESLRGGRSVRTFGETVLVVDGVSKTVDLERDAGGTYLLAVDGTELSPR